MFKRKLFKRALPVILSVAMIFQSTPATALCYFLIIYCSVCMEGKILAAYFFAQAQKMEEMYCSCPHNSGDRGICGYP